MGATLILVIGSPTSSNAQRLVEVARARAAPRRADRRRERDRRRAARRATRPSALTAGASTPEELVAGRARAARRRAATTSSRRSPSPARTSTSGCRREVAAQMTSVEIPHSVAAALPTLSVFDITNEISRDVERSGHDERGIAYVTAGSTPSSLVRVSERESGLLLRRRGAARAARPAGRPRSASASARAARPAHRADPVRRRPALPRPVAARAALRLRRRHPRRATR